MKKPRHDATSIFGLSAGSYRRLLEALAGVRRVLVFSGSGLSADSGLPTYRGGVGALWNESTEALLATPEGFASQPEFAWGWYRARCDDISRVQPHAGHAALVALEQRMEVIHATQNVDGLLQRAGASRVLELHGSIWRRRCMVCGREEASAGASDIACRRCGGLLRPDVVWFGEPLPPAAFDAALAAARGADLTLVVGTPAEVYPAAAIPESARSAGKPIAVINPEPCENLHYADWQLFGSAGEVLPRLTRDLGRTHPLAVDSWWSRLLSRLAGV